MKNSIIGNKWGRLTAVSFSHREKYTDYYTFRCDCGNEKVLRIYNVQNGNTKSCGCYRVEHSIKMRMKMNGHGLSRENGKQSTLYKAWLAMRERCSKNIPKFKYWAGKGISVCEEWSTYPPFHYWAMSHGWGKGLSINRIDPNKGYCPENCEWITRGLNTIKAHLGTGGWKRDKNRKKIFTDKKEGI